MVEEGRGFPFISTNSAQICIAPATRCISLQWLFHNVMALESNSALKMDNKIEKAVLKGHDCATGHCELQSMWAAGQSILCKRV